MNRMTQMHGQRNFSFMPECYVWPGERELVLEALKKNRLAKNEASLGSPTRLKSHKNANVEVPWIVKPAGSCQGKGISIITSADQLPKHRHGANDENWVVEKYISNPLLLEGRKCDLRIYVAVTSFGTSWCKFTILQFNANI